MSKDLDEAREEHKESMKQYWNNAQRAVPRMPQNDPVNHPTHYTDGGIETIDFIEAKKLNYNRGNAVKYISRAGKKFDFVSEVGLEKDIQDLEKAIWYLNREIRNLRS